MLERVKFGQLKGGVSLPQSVFDSSNLEKDTDFISEISFTEGVKRTAEWVYREQNKPEKSKRCNYV